MNFTSKRLLKNLKKWTNSLITMKVKYIYILINLRFPISRSFFLQFQVLQVHVLQVLVLEFFLLQVHFFQVVSLV